MARSESSLARYISHSHWVSAQQSTPLRKLLELRNSLANLRSSLIGNEKLENLLQEMIQNQEMLQQAGSEAGIRSNQEKES